MPIRKLPTLLINQIAAGEVIERPASVVKELVENALDAGATRVDVAIEDGGRQLIRISDNGCGIVEDELLLAVAPHATSKLQSAEDLAAIGTLGFRGEALASIASVSRLRIVSRPTVEGKTAEAGAQLVASGAEVGVPSPVACAPGTVIEVRDLFFNTPARRKFMRGASAEFGHISEMLTRIAMTHPGVAFKLTHNDRKVMELGIANGQGARRQRCVELLGRDLDEAMLEFEHIEPLAGDGASVWGLAGLPSIARATAKFQYVCLNGRPIRNKNISHAIKEAYRGLMPPDRQPVVVLMLDIDPAAVDVNVHPAKSEVRFVDTNRVHGLVLHALRQRLLAADLTPAVQFGNPLLKGHSDARFDVPRDVPHNIAQEGAAYASASASQGEAASVDSFVNYFRRMDPRQKGFIYQQVKEELQREQPEMYSQLQQDQTEGQDALPARDVAGSDAQSRLNLTGTLMRDGVLQVHKSYLITQDEHGVLIVDQHALHERVMFEELKQRILKGKLESQRLLMPATFSASPARIALLEPLGPLLERIGIEAQAFGESSVAIHAFATFLFDRKVDPVEFMEELLDKAENDMDVDTFATSVTSLEDALHEVLDMMSCKAAVKAGDQLSQAELDALLARREQIERSSNCPHGRPTSIRLSLRDLERQFGRS